MNEIQVSEGTLLRKVRDLFDDPSVPTALEIYRKTGVPPNQQWAIKKGRTRSPSVNTVEALYTFLSGKALEL